MSCVTGDERARVRASQIEYIDKILNTWRQDAIIRLDSVLSSNELYTLPDDIYDCYCYVLAIVLCQAVAKSNKCYPLGRFRKYINKIKDLAYPKN